MHDLSVSCNVLLRPALVAPAPARIACMQLMFFNTTTLYTCQTPTSYNQGERTQTSVLQMTHRGLESIWLLQRSCEACTQVHPHLHQHKQDEAFHVSIGAETDQSTG